MQPKICNRPPTPPDFRCTSKQKEVLSLLTKGYNATSIARHLNKNKSTITRCLESCQKKGFVKKDFGGWLLTKEGQNVLNRGCMGSCSVPEKNIHSNKFTVSIEDFPRQWTLTNMYFQDLQAKDYFQNKASGQWVVYFEDCNIIISPNARMIDFWIKKQQGNSYDEILSNVWDIFAHYFKLLENKGFKLNNHVLPKNPEFANPNSFFAKLASLTTNTGYRITTTQGDFWVDFSPPDNVAEEETDKEDVAMRLEKIGHSALTSESDFNTVDKLLEIAKLRIRHDMIRFGQEAKQEKRPDYFG